MCNDGTFMPRSGSQGGLTDEERRQLEQATESLYQGGDIPPTTTDAYIESVPRTRFTVFRKRRQTVMSSTGNRYSPEVVLYVEFDHVDTDRARHQLRDVMAEAERRLAEIEEARRRPR